MNSHDGAVCGCSAGKGKDLLRGGYPRANICGADLDGIDSGDEARVVPNHNEGTGEDGDVKLGKGSHSSIAMAGMLLPPAEKLARSSAVKVAGIVVSRLRCVGEFCQSKEVGVLLVRFWSMDSMPCMGALTCLAN
jgi:hypothetical protein